MINTEWGQTSGLTKDSSLKCTSLPFVDHVFLDDYKQNGAGEILLNSLKN